MRDAVRSGVIGHLRYHRALRRWKMETEDDQANVSIEPGIGFNLLRLLSRDETNRLTRARVKALADAVARLAAETSPQALILTGNHKFFSAGADLNEIAALRGPDACQFARMGQELMSLVERFPAPVIAAISGYCMGGGLDLALACHVRVCARNAIFGHRGAALGIITGWGGTQRLTRLVGRSRALQMFLTAEKLHATEALRCGLALKVGDDPVQVAAGLITDRHRT